jgi:AraC-like DNA-binding protein
MKTRPLALAVVDPYEDGSLQLEPIARLGRHNASRTVCYVDLSRQPAGEHVRLILSSGIVRVITARVDDSPREMAEIFDRTIGSNLLTTLLERARDVLPWKEYLAVQWAIREGWHKTSVDAMAAALGVQPRSVRRWFGNRSELSPRDVVVWGRLLNACLLLKVTGLSQRQVADMLGFRSVREFSDKYRGLVGEGLVHVPPEKLFAIAARAFLETINGDAA